VLSFNVLSRTRYAARLSKPVWVLDRAPNPTPCVTGTRLNKSYSCASGGPGGMATAAANTWALGHPLKPGRAVVFDWWLTAVQPGHYTVAWRFQASVWGQARAVLGNGSVPRGRFSVTITNKPQQSYVDNNGQIVQTNRPVPPPQGLNSR
jgi:hypothetical protein